MRHTHPVSLAVNTREAIERARRQHQAGRLSEAGAIYREILAAEPGNADAMHLLGVLAGQTGKHEAAVDWIRRAIAVRPDHPESHKNLGIALKDSGRPDEAIAAFRKAIALKPDYAEAHKNLGSALHHTGRLAEAVASYRQAVGFKPDFADAHGNLGVALTKLGQLDEALDACRRAVALKPRHPETHNNLGNALHDNGQMDDAIAAYRMALQLKPDFAPAANNLGLALKAGGRPDEAVAAFRVALRSRPDYPDACVNMGNALNDQGRNEEAISAFHEALRLKPDHADAFSGLGNALRDQGRIEEAIAAYRKAIELKPDSPDSRHLLAAMTGNGSPSTSPAGYVRKLFDQYAHRFDEHLTGQLQYRVPDQLLDAVRSAAPGRIFDVLDLGCGTGLCGVSFRCIARGMVGVDLSPRMIAKASARGIYDRLITADLAEAMRDREGSFDLILAGDLFVYVGDLGAVFPAAARTLRAGGLFAFSLERHDGEGFVLHSKVRFAHSLAYIRELSRIHGFAELHVREIAVRKSGPDDVAGWLVVLQKQAAGPVAA